MKLVLSLTEYWTSSFLPFTTQKTVIFWEPGALEAMAQVKQKGGKKTIFAINKQTRLQCTKQQHNTDVIDYQKAFG